MYAIVDIAGQQFKVEKEQKIYVHRLEAKEGDVVDFDKVLLVDNEGKVNVGAPLVKDAAVSAKVIAHLRGDKVIVFKKKRRKSYQKSNGHRQYFTQIQIEDISLTKAKAAPKKEEAPKTEEAPAAEAKTKKAVTAETKKAPAKKTTEAKSTTAKKTTAAKKTTTKKSEE